MATLTVVPITVAGVTPAGASAAGGGDEFVNTGKEFIEVTNGSGGALTVTAATAGTIDGLPIADNAVSVAAGATARIGPFNPKLYNDGNGKVQLTYSGVTSLNVKVLQLTAQ